MAWQTTGGNLRGPRGLQGVKGDDGRSITSAAINAEGELLLTFSDTGQQNMGVVQGAQGPKGEDGTSVTITGTVANSAALPTGLGPEDAGKGYITEDDGHLHVWSGSTFVDAGEIRGPAGADGSKGAKGDPGDPGVRGSRWYTGNGTPGTIEGSRDGDHYLDESTGDIYTLTSE